MDGAPSPPAHRGFYQRLVGEVARSPRAQTHVKIVVPVARGEEEEEEEEAVAVAVKERREKAS